MKINAILVVTKFIDTFLPEDRCLFDAQNFEGAFPLIAVESAPPLWFALPFSINF